MKTYNGVIKIMLLIGAFLPAVLSAQWLETTIMLPDSFGGLTKPMTFCYNSINNKVYVGGQGGYLMVIDEQTNQKIAKIPIYPGIFTLCYNPVNNKIYCQDTNTNMWNLSVIDGLTNNILTHIPTGLCFNLVYNSIDNKIYCTTLGFTCDSLKVVDGSSNSILSSRPLLGIPLSMCYNNISNKIYCAQFAADSTYHIDVIDCTSDSLLSTIIIEGNDLYYMQLLYNSINNKIYASFLDTFIVVIDGAGDTIINTIPTECSSSGVYNSINNKIYCSDTNRYTIVIDGSIDSIMYTLPVFGMPYHNSNNNKMYVLGMESLYVINAVTDSIIKGIPTDSGTWFALCNTESNNLYAGSYYFSKVDVMDCDIDSFFATISFKSMNPYVLLYNPLTNKLYCGESPGENIAVIDGTSNNLLSMIRTGFVPFSLGLNTTNNKIYTTKIDTILVIDGANDSIIKSLTVGRNPFEMTYNTVNNKMYVVNRSSNNVSVIDGAMDSVVATVPVGSNPHDVVYNPLNNKIYCSNTSSSNITIIDGATDSVICAINTTGPPKDLTYNSINNKIYCANSQSNGTVDVIDGATNTLITYIHVGYYPSCLTYNSTTNKVYCATAADSVVVINGATNVVLRWLHVGINPSSLIHDPINNKVYCANYGSNDVYVISGGILNGIIDTIQVGTNPCASAWNPPQNRIYIANYSSSSISVLRDVNAVEEGDQHDIKGIRLHTAPNPFRHALGITMGYGVEGGELMIFNIAGELVKHLPLSEVRSTGPTIIWNGKDDNGIPLSSGIYFVHLESGGQRITEKVVKLK